MNLVNNIKNGTLSFELECDLAILNNLNKSSLGYNRAFNRVKPIIIENFIENDFDFQEVDIHAELYNVLEVFTEYSA